MGCVLHKICNLCDSTSACRPRHEPKTSLPYYHEEQAFAYNYIKTLSPKQDLVIPNKNPRPIGWWARIERRQATCLLGERRYDFWRAPFVHTRGLHVTPNTKDITLNLDLQRRSGTESEVSYRTDTYRSSYGRVVVCAKQSLRHPYLKNQLLSPYYMNTVKIQ